MDNQRILKEGELVQWYRIEEVLGRGGFGVTYLATDTNLDHKVAIKEYMPGWAVERLSDNSLVPLSDKVRPDFDLGVSNFLREARTLVKFRHPNIVRVMTVFEANNTAYLVMEYEEGEEFKAYVQRGAGIDESSLTSLILRIVDGLDQVHQYGFLHRDIKPVNLIIRNDGTPVLLDFGAARPADGEGAHTAYVSAGYTPIEQYQEGDGMEVGPWTDIYALGATLYYAISGKTPVGPTGRLAALVRKSPDPLEPALSIGSGRYSDPFLEAIDWALSFRPADRPRNLTEWRDALDASSALEEQRLRPDTRNSHQPLMGDYPAADQRSPSHRYRESQVRQRSSREKKSPALRWLLTLCAGFLLAVAGSWLYRGYLERSAFDALIVQANGEFDKGMYVEGAVPLYRQVLAADPDNLVARSKLEKIEEIVLTRVNVELDSGEFEQADRSVGELRKISSNDETINDLVLRLQIARRNQATEDRLNQAQSVNQSGDHQQALALLGELRAERQDDPRVKKIEADAQAAIDAGQARESQLAQQRDAQKRKEAANDRRIEAANRRARQRRQTYNSYLSNAENAVSDGDIETARDWLDDARSLQINDSRLSELESQVVAQETYQRKPLSEYEVSYATGQFNALRRAIGSKNQQAIVALTEGSPTRQGLFDTLFKRYTRLDAKIVDVKTALDPKRVTAKLRIETMTLPNGDIVYPSPAYRDSELTLNRERYGWSQIIW